MTLARLHSLAGGPAELLPLSQGLAGFLCLNAVTQVGDRCLHKRALLFLQAQSCFFKSTKDFVQCLQVLFCRLAGH